METYNGIDTYYDEDPFYVSGHMFMRARQLRRDAPLGSDMDVALREAGYRAGFPTTATPAQYAAACALLKDPTNVELQANVLALHDGEGE